MRDLRARRPPGEARDHGRVRDAEHRHRGGVHRDPRTTAGPTGCPSPSCPGSFYHVSKVHDSHNIHFACRIWGLRATDLNQGVVYGIQTEETKLDPRLATRFDYDEVFGTALNRFCLQAVIGHPLTVYGTGGQTRGYLNIVDTLQCVELAALNPADRGRVPRVQPVHRAVLGQRARRARPARPAREVRPRRDVEHLENPRVEAEEHYYNADAHQAARPRPEAALLSETLIESMFVGDRAAQGPRDHRRHPAARPVAAGRRRARDVPRRQDPRGDRRPRVFVRPARSAALPAAPDQPPEPVHLVGPSRWASSCWRSDPSAFNPIFDVVRLPRRATTGG